MHVADVKAYLDRFGPRLCQLYGQGETPMTITGMAAAVYADCEHPRWEARIASAGLPQSAVEVKWSMRMVSFWNLMPWVRSSVAAIA